MRFDRNLLLVGLVLLGSARAFAADLPSPNAQTVEEAAPAGQPYWSFTAGTYLWAAGMSGDVG
ncbi:MAG: hypothetical protein E5W21_35500, partial [Mesorhizobium sp.]